MPNCRNLLLVSGALLLLPGAATAQKSFSVVAGGQMHVMQARLVDTSLPNLPLDLAPHLYQSFMLGAAVGLSPRYAVQATVGRSAYGIRFKAFSAGKIGFSQDAREYTLVLRRQYPMGNQSGHVWFTDLGVDMLSAGGAGVVGFGIDSSRPSGPGGNGPGISIVGASNFRNFYRAGLRLGAGREWALSKHHHLAVGVLASIGLSDLERYQMQIVTWQQSRTIDPVFYENTLATRSSFVGVQARYRFQL